jgi:hypothetical protein
VYFSESALNEVDDARYTRSSGYSAGFTGKLVSLTRETTVALNQPGSADLVKFALAGAGGGIAAAETSGGLPARAHTPRIAEQSDQQTVERCRRVRAEDRPRLSVRSLGAFRLVCAELQLEDASVRSHIDTVDGFEAPEPGCYARFASQQTARARKAVWRDEGFITRWERRPPLRRARVVAITSDVRDSSEDADAESAVLARPILIRDLSS